MRNVRMGLATVVAAAVLVLAACSSSSPEASSSSTSQPTSTAGGSTSASTNAASSTNSSSGGSSSGSSGSGTESDGSAAAEVKRLRKVPTFTAPGPAIDVKALKGKKIFVIPISATGLDSGIHEAEAAIADKLGITLTYYPTQGQVSQWVQGMQTAIAQKPDLIMLEAAPDPRQLQPQIAQAKAAGIPVLVSHFYDTEMPDPPTCEGCAAGVTAVVKAPLTAAARAEANWIITDSGGKANVLFIGLSDVLPTPGIVKAFQDEFAKNCPACKVTVQNIPLSQLATGLTTTVSSALTKDPSINYIDPLGDALVPGVLPALHSTGRTEVKVVSFNGSPGVLKYIAQGDANVVADVGESADWIGFANMDQAFRVMLGQPTVEQNTPIRIWDKTNIAEQGQDPSYTKGFGDAYANGYYQLWGMGS